MLQGYVGAPLELCFETTQGGFDFDIFFLTLHFHVFCGIPPLGVEKNGTNQPQPSIPTTLRG